MWELDHKESWAPKNRHFQTAVLEKMFESPLDYKEIKPVNPKGNQSSVFTGRTADEAETWLLWQSDVKSQLFRKYPDAGNDWRQEKGTKEDEMVGWHDWLKTWAWANSRIWWRTRKPGVLQYMYGVGKSRTWKKDWTRIQMETLKIQRQIRSQD